MPHTQKLHALCHAHTPTIAALYPQVIHIYNLNGKHEIIDTLRGLEKKVIWDKALTNEWGRLAQGNCYGVLPTDTISFIFWHEVPSDWDITYASFVYDHHPLKTEPWRVQIVMGGDRLSYSNNTGSPAASLLKTKILLNSTISDADKGARFMSLDLKDFFLATPMPNPEFMKVPFKYFPQDIVDKYKLSTKLHNDYIYIKIKKGMYGLKQADHCWVLHRARNHHHPPRSQNQHQMHLFWWNVRLYEWKLLPLQKQKQAACSIMDRPLSIDGVCLLLWGIHNHQTP